MSDALPIGSITVRDRHRADLGDLGPLAESIAEVGLLHPVVVTEDGRLVAGQRRLEACRKLGWDEVPVTVVGDLDSAAGLLVAERDENTCRLDMKPSELHALGRALEEMERPKARERMSEGGRGARPSTPSKTRDTVGPALGLSGFQYQRLKHLGDRAAEGDAKAQALLDEVDNGDRSISSAYQSLRRDELANKPDKKQRLSATERSRQIKKLAAEGHRAGQIANKLDLTPEHVRNLARDHDIELPDAALGKTRRVDSNRVVRETASMLEGAAMGLELVEVDDLDPDEIEGWATSFNDSLRSLNRFGKQLKEMTREQA